MLITITRAPYFGSLYHLVNLEKRMLIISKAIGIIIRFSNIPIPKSIHMSIIKLRVI